MAVGLAATEELPDGIMAATLGSRQAHPHPDEPVGFPADSCGHIDHPQLSPAASRSTVRLRCSWARPVRNFSAVVPRHCCENLGRAQG
jgi:hypothetical protein